MKPVDFKEQNVVLEKPQSMSDEDCETLPVFTNGSECLSKWRPSAKERLKILFGADLWLLVLSGKTQPPVCITLENVFKDEEKPKKSKLQKNGKSMKKFFRKVKEVFKQADKKKHYAAGFCISLVIGLLAPITGLIIGCVAGALKEWYDSKGYGTVELADFLCTALGSLTAFPLSLVIHNLIW